MGGKTPGQKGDNHERDLVNKLDGQEFGVLRSPSSGSGTDRELPDITIGNGYRYYAMESKYSSGDPIYIDKEEMEDLAFFCRKFGARLRIAVKFKVGSDRDHPDWGHDERDGWRFLTRGDLHETEESYRIKKRLALDKGFTLPELVDRSTPDDEEDQGVGLHGPDEDEDG